MSLLVRKPGLNSASIKSCSCSCRIAEALPEIDKEEAKIEIVPLKHVIETFADIELGE